MKHYLVPLDGSELAELVLPIVRGMAHHIPARITLFHAIEKRPPATIHGEHHLQSGKEAQAYLEEKAQLLRADGIEVDVHVHEGEERSVAQTISLHAQEMDTEMVIMCTHGSGGLRDFFFGSIAQQVLQQGTRSILLLPPQPEHLPLEGNFQHMLVPLDGTPAHESALASAIDLSKIYQAQLSLVLVVPTLETLQGEQAANSIHLPSAMRAVLEVSEESAKEYLAGEAERCQEEGIRVDTTVLRGDIITSLRHYVKEKQLDLVVMASHASTGLDAFFRGSITPQASEQLSCPLLIIHTSDGRL